MGELETIKNERRTAGPTEFKILSSATLFETDTEFWSVKSDWLTG